MKNGRRAARMKISNSQLTDRNELFENLQQQQPDKTINIVSQHTIKQPSFVTNKMFLADIPKAPEYKTLLVQNDGSVQMISTPEECGSAQSQLPEPVISNVENDIKLIKDEIMGIKDELSGIKTEAATMKNEIKNEYSKINLNLDKIYKLIANINVLPKAVDLPTNKEDLLQAFNFPLNSCEEIEAVDKQIQNNLEFKSQLVTFLSKIGGTSREEDGGKVAYKVIDQFFSSSVLINYTWTGVSRGKNSTPKKPFQILEGILDVFFQVISLADSRHTKQKNCNIFKEGVLKYAIKRSLRKRSKPGCNDTNPVPNEETDHITEAEDKVHNQLPDNLDIKTGNAVEEPYLADEEQDSE